MWILVFLELALLLILYAVSKDKYKELLGAPESMEYSLHKLLPISLKLLDLAGYEFTSRYDRKIQKVLLGIYDAKSLGMHTRLFYGNKLMSMLLAILILTFFGAAAGKPDYSYLVFCIAVPILLFFLYDTELEKKLQKRYAMIRADFPDMVSKLVLLINAGMTLNRAWEKICTDTKKNTPLYKELKITYQQIQAGKPEAEAYEAFAKRCRIKEISKFISLIIQNMRKGTSDLVPLLKLQADECWELRKGRAKLLGEEASAKLLLPIMIMFIGILMIVMLPAVLQLSSL